MNNLALELFCGSGSFSKVARTFGYETISVDNRRRKGVCEPTLKIDIEKVSSSLFSSLKPKVMWLGLPCDIWSVASGGLHLDKDFNPKTEKAEKHLALFYKSTQIIMESMPDFWFIENPRGRLNKYPGLYDFLEKANGVIKECTLSSYGFPTIKPTVIITNFRDLELKPLDPFGRGNKNKVPGLFDKLTKVQRQKTPEKLIKHILSQIEKHPDHSEIYPDLKL